MIMKKILLLLIMCLLIGCSEKRVLIDELTNKGTITTPILYSGGKVFNGVCYEIFPNGNLMFEGKFVDSRVDGIFKWYYDSGEVMYEWNYQNGKKEGIQKQFFKTGQLKIESNYNNDSRNGLQKEFFEDLQIRFF